MCDIKETKISDEALGFVTGGAAETETYTVRPISRIKVRVTSSSLKCRYSPGGAVAMEYERGHEFWVDGITDDDVWYRVQINDPVCGTCEGYIAKRYTELV